MKKVLLMMVLVLTPFFSSYARDEKEKAIDWESLGRNNIYGTVSFDNVVSLSAESNISNAQVLIHSNAGTILFNGVVDIPSMGFVQLPISTFEPNENTIQIVIPEIGEQEEEILEGEF